MGQIYDNAHLARHSERRGMGSIVRSNGGALDGGSLNHMLNLRKRFAAITKTPCPLFFPHTLIWAGSMLESRLESGSSSTDFCANSYIQIP